MPEEDVREIVQHAVCETLLRLGLRVDDSAEFQADMIYLRKSRKGSDELQRLVRRSALGVCVTALLFAVWEGIKALIKRDMS